MSPDGASVYAASLSDGPLTVFSRDATSALTVRGCLTAGGVPGCAQVASLNGAAGVTVSPDGSSVYLAAYPADAVVHLSRELPSGSPGAPGAPAGPSPGAPPAPTSSSARPGRTASSAAGAPT